MKLSLQKLIAGVVTASLLLTATFANAAKKDIVDTAVAAGSFKTLAAALGAADLVDTLKGDGPFTVFAPTDEAFAQLPKGTVETLLKPENKDKLTAILTYHVVSGKVLAKQVVGLKGAQTVNGQRVDITVDGSNVQVDKANVVTTDIKCSNGVIHVIDSVILPTSNDIVTTASEAGSFNTLLAAAKAAGLAGALTGEGPFTVFAPTDEAFAKLPKGTVESLLKPENKTKLADILKYHVVSGRVYSEAAVAAKSAKTLQGQEVQISVKSGQAQVNSAKIVATDIDASNGVIHVIDSVILPAEKKLSAAEARHRIQTAVSHGVKKFNAGHHAECATIYMTAMKEMVEAGDHMPEHIIADMKHVMTKAQHTHCSTQKSWTLRHGLDRAYARMANLK